MNIRLRIQVETYGLYMGDYMINELYLKLYSYHESLLHAKIINKSQINYYIDVEIPHDISKKYRLYDIVRVAELNKDGGYESINFTGKVIKECGHPWLKIEFSLLSDDIGYHMYKFSFIDVVTKSIINLYLTYQIQSDTPERSYIYMK